jgi:hypothetical protein
MPLNARPSQGAIYSLLVSVFLFLGDKILFWWATDGNESAMSAFGGKADII